MRPSTIWPILPLLLITAVRVPRVQGCSCYPQHPQTQFCVADFVAVVRVKKEYPGVVDLLEDHDRAMDEKAYKVKVNRVFKATDEAREALRQGFLWTPPMESLCGVSLDVGETYVVGGKVEKNGRAKIGLCDLVVKWAEVTNRQRKGFRQLYHRGCVCEIQYTHWLRKGVALESTNGKGCVWESIPGPQHCQERYGVCDLGRAGCSWVPSALYKSCITEHREHQRDHHLLQQQQQRTRGEENEEMRN